ncbi:MAG: hypothetical protein BWY73_01362 [candidate division TA06 bacterium ADurb.Bin417]|uniref:Uncharacterized protein n=1 Tax=candidate division TA06 bacterium ADurb.Bin417 TaxID=1852828 RepID=A0A1V5MAJ3_UNCT6|nr:MAG: hypothetical protein BWY73_01362 [candidate division TA06 bacterium ADurb.Bin417]
MAPHHALDTHGQGNGNHGRQAFRNGRHRQADRGQKNLQQFAAPPPFKQEDQHHQRQTDIDDETSELLQLLLKRGGLVADGLDKPGDPAQFGRHAGGHHQRPGLAAADRGAQVNLVGPVGQRNLRFLEGQARLQNRGGLSGQAGFQNAEVVGVINDAAVGRHVIAGLQLDKIPRHQLGGRPVLEAAAPPDPGDRAGQSLQGGQGLLGPVLLDKTEHRIKNHDAQDGQGIHPLLQEAGDEGGADQYPDDKILELGEE